MKLLTNLRADFYWDEISSTEKSEWRWFRFIIFLSKELKWKLSEQHCKYYTERKK